MSTSVTPIPNGYAAVTPYLILPDARKAMAFYADVFGAIELFRMEQPDGRVGHAEMQITTARIMLADEFPEIEATAPTTIGGSPVSFVLYVDDVDAVVGKATAAGARLRQPIEDKFYGDRMGTLVDPFGHVWHVATHIEDVPPEELQRRAAAAGKREV
ncbi:MAG: VOC family protein [Alphaproteobacteria bacterium]